MNTHQVVSPAAAPASTTQASSQSLHSHKSAPPQCPHPPCIQLLTCGGGEERRGEKRGGEVALSGGRLGVRLASRGSRVTTLTLSLSLFLFLPPPSPSPNVGSPSPCLTAVCQTIPLSPLWEIGWTPSRWAATVTTSSTPDLLPLTWWPRWQQSEWRGSEFS